MYSHLQQITYIIINRMNMPFTHSFPYDPHDSMDLGVVHQTEVQNDRLYADPQHPQQHTEHRAHHPGLTGYRLLVILLTAIFGLSKAGLSYNGQSTVPTTLDWMYGVVVFVLLYWLGIYEKHTSHNLGWFFEVDYLSLLWRFMLNRR